MAGVTRHNAVEWLTRCCGEGVAFVNISPARGAKLEETEAGWLPIRSNTDAAFMTGVAYMLEIEAFADHRFLGNRCQGYHRFRRSHRKHDHTDFPFDAAAMRLTTASKAARSRA